MIINRVQVLNYGCLHYVDVPLDRFHVFVGPNASGKSTLMDAIKFVSDVVRDGVDAACRARTSNFADLVWVRPQDPKKQRFEIALEFGLPEEVRDKMPEQRSFSIFRYEMAVAPNVETGRIGLAEEKGALLLQSTHKTRQLSMFPDPIAPSQTILQPSGRGRRTVFRMSGRRTEPIQRRNGCRNRQCQLEPRADPEFGPFCNVHFTGLRRQVSCLHPGFGCSCATKSIGLSLNSGRMRQASPPGMGLGLRPDGSNVPWVADSLLEQDEERARWWMGHMKTALAGFASVRVIDRPDDRHKYLMLKYENGLEVPSLESVGRHPAVHGPYPAGEPAQCHRPLHD